MKTMKDLGFVAMMVDPASFIRRSDGVLLNTHVDDVTLYGEEAALEELEEALEKKFERECVPEPNGLH